MTRRLSVTILVVITVGAFTALTCISLQVQARRVRAGSFSTTPDEDCLTATPWGVVYHSIVLDGLERPTNRTASRYVITNEADALALTVHSYCDAEQMLVGTDYAELPPEEDQIFDLGATGAAPEGYAGYAIVRSDQLITGTILPSEIDLGVALEPDHTRRAEPGATLLYDHVLSNTGTATDTYSVDVTSTQGWAAALLGAGQVTPTKRLTLQLGPRLLTSLQVSLTVPADAEGITEVTVLTATSQASPAVQDTARDTTIVCATAYLPLVANRWPPIP